MLEDTPTSYCNVDTAWPGRKQCMSKFVKKYWSCDPRIKANIAENVTHIPTRQLYRVSTPSSPLPQEIYQTLFKLGMHISSNINNTKAFTLQLLQNRKEHAIIRSLIFSPLICTICMPARYVCRGLHPLYPICIHEGINSKNMSHCFSPMHNRRLWGASFIYTNWQWTSSRSIYTDPGPRGRSVIKSIQCHMASQGVSKYSGDKLSWWQLLPLNIL